MRVFLFLMLLSGLAYAGVLDLPEKTREQVVADTVLDIKQYIRGAQRARESAQRVAFDMVWRNSEATPQEIITGFGTDAVQLFILSRQNEEQIKVVNPSWEYLIPPYEVTLNEDGTVTVGNCISEECGYVAPEAPAQ